MAMTRKEIRAVAEAIALARFANQRHADGSVTHFATRDAMLSLLAYTIGANLAEASPAFDREAFLASCKLESAPGHWEDALLTGPTSAPNPHYYCGTRTSPACPTGECRTPRD